MKSRSHSRGLLAALSLLAPLGGCAVLRSPPPLTPEVAYSRGMEAYNAGNWGRAATLLQAWADASPGDPRLAEGLYALGTSRARRGEQILASAAFMRVVTEFPSHPLQADARFRVCGAYRDLSPRVQLDQEHTRTALAHCESYAEYYPDTPQADTARAWGRQLRDKLARKAYESGAWYARRGYLDAAVIYFQDAATGQNQDTPTAPAALLRLAETYDRLGYREEAEAARERLRTEHPQSEQARSLPARAPPATPPS